MACLSIQTSAIAIDAMNFRHVLFKRPQLRRAGCAAVLFVELTDQAFEISAVLHGRIPAPPSVRDVQVAGSVEPDILLLFGQFLPRRF